MDLIPILFLLIYIIQIAGIAAKPSPYRWMFFPPVAVIATYLLLRSNVEAVTTLLLIASDFLVLTDVQRELRLKGQTKSISDAPLSDRLIWAVKLITGPRGIGWEHEPTAALAPRPAGLTRGQFIVSRVKLLVLYALLLDVGQMIIRHNPSFHKTALPIAEQGLLSCSYAMLTYLIHCASIMTIVHTLIPSLVLVTAGLSEPSEWPHIFGSWSDAYTIHNFWRLVNPYLASFSAVEQYMDSRTWQQLMRRVSLIFFVLNCISTADLCTTIQPRYSHPTENSWRIKSFVSHQGPKPHITSKSASPFSSLD